MTLREFGRLLLLASAAFFWTYPVMLFAQNGFNWGTAFMFVLWVWIAGSYLIGRTA